MDSAIKRWVVFGVVIFGLIALTTSVMASGGTGCPKGVVQTVGVRTDWILVANSPTLPNSKLLCLEDTSMFGAWLLVAGKWCKVASAEDVLARYNAWQENRSNG